MIGTAIEAKGIISARTNFYDAVDGEVLGIVFQIVPRTRVNVPHVGAGNVDIAGSSPLSEGWASPQFLYKNGVPSCQRYWPSLDASERPDQRCRD